MSQYRFGGAAGGSKIRWPLRLRALVIKAHRLDDLKGAKAFEAGVAAFNALGGEQIATLPPSYCGKNAASLLYGLEKKFLAQLNAGNADVVAVAQELGIVVEQ